MNQFFALLDIGGSFIKSGIVDVNFAEPIVHFKTKTPENVSNTKNKYEISTQQFKKQVKYHVDYLTSFNKKFSGLLISGQMGSWILTNHFNIPLTEIISWQDKRILNSNCTEFLNIKNTLSEDWLKNTGNELREGLPLIGLTTFNSNTFKENKVRFHSLISWTASIISSKYDFKTHVTDSASSGIFDIKKVNWSNEAINILKFDLELPSVSEALVETGYSNNLKCRVYTSVGDQQASLYGAGLAENKVVVNIGTGGQVSSLDTFSNFGNLQVRPFFDSKKILTRTHLPAGKIIDKFVKKLYPFIDEEYMFTRFLEDAKNYEFRSESATEINSMYSSDFFDVEPNFVPSALINWISVSYKKSLLDFPDSYPLIFAGGIGQKFDVLRDRISNSRSFSVSDTSETTLRGLAQLARQLNNLES